MAPQEPTTTKTTQESSSIPREFTKLTRNMFVNCKRNLKDSELVPVFKTKFPAMTTTPLPAYSRALKTTNFWVRIFRISNS